MRTWSKMNKTKAILLHLQENCSITSWEVIKEYGATRLSAIIYNLRHNYGLDIISDEICFVDRYGTPSSYAKYILVREDTN